MLPLRQYLFCVTPISCKATLCSHFKGRYFSEEEDGAGAERTRLQSWPVPCWESVEIYEAKKRKRKKKRASVASYCCLSEDAFARRMDSSTLRLLNSTGRNDNSSWGLIHMSMCACIFTKRRHEEETWVVGLLLLEVIEFKLWTDTDSKGWCNVSMSHCSNLPQVNGNMKKIFYVQHI